MKGRKGHIDIDEVFRDGLEEVGIEPSPGFRGSLMRRVSYREFLRFNPSRFNIWYLATAVAAVSLAVTFLLSDDNINDDSYYDIPAGVEISPTEGSEDTRSELLVTGEEISVDRHVSGGVLIESKRQRDVQDSDTGIYTGRREADMADTLRHAAVAASVVTRQTTTVGGEEIKRSEPVMVPVSSFIISALEGCAPMSVALQSTSENHSSLKWRSSDGRTDDSAVAEWLFETPGRYTIILTASDESGRSDYATADITVYAPPSARFDIVPVNRSVSDREIFLYNYSDNALKYSWDFGDGNSSELAELVHHYSEPGNYRIQLTVTDTRGCRDSVSVLYEAATSDYRIEFPNAFIPNRNGPTGGYYTARSTESAQVFHPYYEGVAEYHLIIYSRTGMVLFESRDLQIGWDGYYRGQLSPSGVYVWRVKGRYINGEEFMKAGDLTLLRL